MPKYAAIQAVLLAALLATPDKAKAQTIDGNIVGTIADATGATVPNARLELENTATGVQYSTISDGSGLYRFNNVPVGSYRLIVSAPGFSTVRLEGIAVELNRTATANVSLQVGGVAESVTVSEAVAAIDTTTAQLQSSYTTRQVIDIPLSALTLGANNLALLSAGVAGSGGYGLGEGPSVGGQRPRNNSFNVEVLTTTGRMSPAATSGCPMRA